MYSNDSSILGVSTVAGSTVLGIALWPDFALIILGGGFILLTILYLLYKRRSRQN